MEGDNQRHVVAVLARPKQEANNECSHKLLCECHSQSIIRPSPSSWNEWQEEAAIITPPWLHHQARRQQLKHAKNLGQTIIPPSASFLLRASFAIPKASWRFSQSPCWLASQRRKISTQSTQITKPPLSISHSLNPIPHHQIPSCAKAREEEAT